MLIPIPTYDNFFNLIQDDLDQLEIKENYSQTNCLIVDKNSPSKYYKAFIVVENSKSKIICEIAFYRSSDTSKYLPRLTFKKIDNKGNVKETDPLKEVIIAFRDSTESLTFWKLIGFLNKFKDVVELGGFENSFSVYSRDKYIKEFESLNEKQKTEEIIALFKKIDIKENDIKSIVFEKRKHTMNGFLFLIKNLNLHNKPSIEIYREKYALKSGDEAVWHHFLKNNDWILGLNVDIKFIRDFYDEQKVGIEDSRGSGSPKADILGVSDYTTLIELKHSGTKIFKKEKTKGRANTWDFTSDFIEGISQCLGQKFYLDKSYEFKDFIDNDGQILDKIQTGTIDPKTVFIIGNRSSEFPRDMQIDNRTRSETFELFRRNSRNIDIITFDELFERAYYTVFSEKVSKNWFVNNEFEL